MDNKTRDALFASALILAGSIYHSTLQAAPAIPNPQPILTNATTTKFIFAQSPQAGSAFASAPVGYIARGLGTAIAVAETEIVLSSHNKPHITRALFTHGISHREPIDTIVSISQTYGKIFFFTELSNYKGENIKHRWEHNGEVVAEVEFKIGAPRWRAYSSKNISHDELGRWTVFVTDSEGDDIFSNTIVVVN